MAVKVQLPTGAIALVTAAALHVLILYAYIYIYFGDFECLIFLDYLTRTKVDVKKYILLAEVRNSRTTNKNIILGLKTSRATAATRQLETWWMSWNLKNFDLKKTCSRAFGPIRNRY